MNRKVLTGLFALMILAAPLLAATPALASENVAYNGAAADSTDATNTTYVATESTLDNFTVNMTEGWTVSDGGTIQFSTNITAANASVSSGSGDLSVTVKDGVINVTDTNTGDAASESLNGLNVTFNVSQELNSSGSVPDAVNVSAANWMETETTLIEDPDGSEVHTYLVYDPGKVVDVTHEFVDSDLEFNGSDIELNGTDRTGEVVFHITRNNTTYENVPLSVLEAEVTLNTTYFSPAPGKDTITATVTGNASVNASTAGDNRTFTVTIANPNNVTTTYDLAVNATAETGTANGTLTLTNTQDPDGGLQSDHTSAYHHAITSGMVSGDFTDVGQPQLVGIAIGLLVVIVFVWYLYKYQDPRMGARGYAAYPGDDDMMYVWLLVVLVGLSMVADYFLTQFNVWADLLAAAGVTDPLMTAVVGGVLCTVAVGLGVRNSTPAR